MIFFAVFYAVVTIVGLIIGANLRKIGLKNTKSKRTQDPLSPEEIQNIIESYDREITAGTADVKCYLEPARLYFEGIGVPKDYKKALGYIYKLLRANPSLGIHSYGIMLLKDDTIMEIRGIDPNEVDIRSAVLEVLAAEEMLREIEKYKINITSAQRALLEDMLNRKESLKKL